MTGHLEKPVAGTTSLFGYLEISIPPPADTLPPMELAVILPSQLTLPPIFLLFMLPPAITFPFMSPQVRLPQHSTFKASPSYFTTILLEPVSPFLSSFFPMYATILSLLSSSQGTLSAAPFTSLTLGPFPLIISISCSASSALIIPFYIFQEPLLF